MNLTKEQHKARLLALLASGAKTSPQLQQALAVSQPTVYRLLGSLSRQVVTLGRARATCYAISRNVRGVGSIFPIYKVTEAGDVRQFGSLTALQGGQYWWEPKGQTGEIFDHLPWFIQDMRPDGFMGRTFAHSISAELGIPERLKDWNDDHVLIALAHRGEDCMGNLILGEESLERYLQGARQTVGAINSSERVATYPDLVREAMAGDPPGSLVGGEQPKFAALVIEDEELRHVLVKFSPSTQFASGRRWADLLICEQIALQIIAERGIGAAKSEIIESNDRVMLEVTRFDRCSQLGRLPMISLEAVDNEYFGELDNWIAAAARLESSGRLAADDANRLRWLVVFGNLTANTDQHFGNISLLIDNAGRSFTLAPAYDVPPMLYRPQETEVPERTFNPKPPQAVALEQWHDAQQWAVRFWRAAAEDQRISRGFRSICEQNLKTVQGLLDGPQLLE